MPVTDVPKTPLKLPPLKLHIGIVRVAVPVVSMCELVHMSNRLLFAWLTKTALLLRSAAAVVIGTAAKAAATKIEIARRRDPCMEHTLPGYSPVSSISVRQPVPQPSLVPTSTDGSLLRINVHRQALHA